MTTYLAVLAAGLLLAIAVVAMQRGHVMQLRRHRAELLGELDAADHYIGALESNEMRTREAIRDLFGQEAVNRLDVGIWHLEIGTVVIEESDQ